LPYPNTHNTLLIFKVIFCKFQKIVNFMVLSPWKSDKFPEIFKEKLFLRLFFS